MKSKAVERLTSITLDTDDSEDSEPEIVDAKELNINNENTGLRRRNVGDTASVYKRSISRMEEMELYDEDDVEEDVQLDKEDEEEVETGSVNNLIHNVLPRYQISYALYEIRQLIVLSVIE